MREFTLYHYSEEPDIRVFAPRPSRLGFDCVWTIDVENAPLYFFPRDCPRVAFWATEATTEADRARFLTGAGAERVVVIESGWLKKMRDTPLFAYTFDATPFVSYTHESPGTHLAMETVVPLSVASVGDLLEKITEAGWELRMMPRLKPLWEPLIASTLHFSGIRLRNALGLS
jgi:hypothetical protein